MPKDKKEKVSVPVDRGLLQWAEKEIKTFRFRNRSHAFEYALAQLKEKLEGTKQGEAPKNV